VIRKKPYFYATAAMVFLTGVSLQSIGSISIVYMTDIGLSAGFVASIATVSSLCLTFTKIFVGTVYDKRGLHFTLLMCQMAAILAFFMKALLTNSVVGMVLAMAATVISTIASPMETVLMPLLTGDLFGTTAYHKVLGVMMAMNSLGLCLGAPLGDLYFDIFGTYRPCFWFFGVSMIAVVIGYRFVIRAAYRDKEAFLTETA
jgi:MFS family permease